MKKRITTILIVVLLLVLSLPISSHAATTSTATANISDDIIITVNGEKVAFKAAIINGKSYLPVRVIGYALNATVDWSDSSREISIVTQNERVPYMEFSDLLSAGGQKTACFVNDINLFLNGEYSNTASEQIAIIENRSYLPIRAISENIGLRSTWNNDTRTIELVNPRTVNVAEADKPYYVKELPNIKTQEDYLVGNWKGYDVCTMDSGVYRLNNTFYITKDTNCTYTIISRITFNDGEKPKYNGKSIVFKYSGITFNPYNNTLNISRDKCKLLESDLGDDWLGEGNPFYLIGDVLYTDYGNGLKARLERF